MVFGTGFLSETGVFEEIKEIKEINEVNEFKPEVMVNIPIKLNGEDIWTEIPATMLDHNKSELKLRLELEFKLKMSHVIQEAIKYNDHYNG